MNTGKFVISLDFELFWGVRDSRTIAGYAANLHGVHTAIPRMLELFKQYGITATFSTVGFLFFETKAELLANIPDRKPQYSEATLSPYQNEFELVGEDHITDKFHFAPLLIKKILSYPGQEIGTHTFSHYYCLEPGQTIEDFRSDIQHAIVLAKKYDITLSSLVFPRNQFNEDYLKVCAELDIICYRGNEHSWLYTAKNANNENKFRRACRLADAYVRLSGHNCYTDAYMRSTYPIDIPSSRFLRPYSKKTDLLEGMRLRRITSGMTHAAKNKLTYHLWWHPHNFGINQDKNFGFLEKILQHYQMLSNKYGFRSITMTNLAHELSNGK